MSPFQRAHDLLDWACEDIVEFDIASQAFLDLKPYVVVSEIDAKTGHNVLKIRFEPVPGELRKLASHAIWDLKHALDHAMWEAVTLIRGRPASDTYFLWASHPNDLNKRLAATNLKNPEGKYPPELWPFIQGVEPYPSGHGYTGGSDELAAFSKMANSSKHAVALAAGMNASLTRFESASPMICAFLDAWDGSKHELTIGHFVPDTAVNMKLQIATNISFGEVELFKDHAAGLVLEQLARAVDSIIGSLECEVFDILAHQGRS